MIDGELFGFSFAAVVVVVGGVLVVDIVQTEYVTKECGENEQCNEDDFRMIQSIHF